MRMRPKLVPCCALLFMRITIHAHAPKLVPRCACYSCALLFMRMRSCLAALAVHLQAVHQPNLNCASDGRLRQPCQVCGSAVRPERAQALGASG